MRTHVSRQIIDNLPRRGPSNSSERKSLHPPIVVAAKRFFEVHRKSVVRDEPVCAALAAGCAARNHQARLTPRVPERLIERGTPDAGRMCHMRNILSAESNKRQCPGSIYTEARGEILLSFRAKSNCRHPQCIQSRCAESARPHRWHPAPPHHYPSSLARSLSLPLALSPHNEIMVIDYPTWKPPSGISITYVCIPTGNLPLIRSNSAVTQFTPASNLK